MDRHRSVGAGQGSQSSYRPGGSSSTSAGQRPPSRFGFGASAASSSGLLNGSTTATAGSSRPSSRLGSTTSSMAGPSQTILGSKRSLSGAGLHEPATSAIAGTLGHSRASGNGVDIGAKRRQHSMSSTGTAMSAAASSRGPTPSPSHDLSSLETEYKRRELLAQKAYDKLQQDYMARAREADKHQQDRIALLRQWEDFNAEVEEERQSATRQRKALSDQVKSLQESRDELAERASRAENDAAKSRQAAHSTRTDLALRISTLEAELATSQAEADNQKQHRLRLEKQLKEQEQDFAQERQTWQGQSNETSKADALTSELSSMLSKTRKLETENLVLHQENKALASHKSSVQALKEQNRSLEKKVGVVDELRRKLAEAEASKEELEGELTTWRQISMRSQDLATSEVTHAAFADPEVPIPAIDEPTELIPKLLGPHLSNLRGALSGLSARVQILSERAASLKKASIESEERAQEEADKCFKLEMELDRAKTAKLTSEKSRETMLMEIESYKKLLDTFQQEAQNMSGQFNASTAEQITVLEAQLKSRDQELDHMRQLLVDAQEKLSQFTASGSISSAERQRLESESEGRHKSLLQALEEQKASYAALEKECISLGKANDDLFARVGRGEFDQSKLRCIELTHNPVTTDRVIRTSTLERLRKENDELLAQVQELSKRAQSSTEPEAGNATQGGLVPAQTLDNLREEYAKLEQTMRDRDKAFDRLKQVFGAKASEYVAAVKTLFGYDMHVVAKGKIKLRSVYARTSKGTSLTFDSADDDVGSMRLVGEARAGAANVAHLKKYWLNSADRSSVPCFLAALQLELYESTTQAARSGWAEEDEE